MSNIITLPNKIVFFVSFVPQHNVFLVAKMEYVCQHLASVFAILVGLEAHARSAVSKIITLHYCLRNCMHYSGLGCSCDSILITFSIYLLFHAAGCVPSCQNGVCLSGSCLCDPGWTGSACSIRTSRMYSQTHTYVSSVA